MLTRRAFLTSLALGALFDARVSGAERNNPLRLGFLWLGPHPPEYHERVVEALRNFGYFEGRNLIVHYRFGGPNELPAQAAELVRLNVDVIHAGSSASTRAAMSATRKIPVVAVDLETDPVASGFASTLARPGGNLTGFFLNFPEFSAKRLEILRETLPGVTHVGAIWDSSMERAPLSGLEAAARNAKLRLSIFELRDDSELPAAFERATKTGVGVVMVMPSPRLDGYRPKILTLAQAHRLPVMALFMPFAVDGALLSYGPDLADLLGRSATYVAKVLGGQSPADLPIQRPAKFYFVVNLKTAHALRVKVPETVLTRADELIR
jgi:ABC-type uncharacterized transport system substrate-binding protein